MRNQWGSLYQTGNFFQDFFSLNLDFY